jgi:hypothetical protein
VDSYGNCNGAAVTLSPGSRGGADPAAAPSVCAQSAAAPLPVAGPAVGRLPATGGLPLAGLAGLLLLGWAAVAHRRGAPAA